MKRTIINVLLLLMLSAALIVSCSQNAGENAAVGEELVDISFSTMTSRALTATREEFKEDAYVWKYEAVKDDATGLTHGQTTAAKYVVNSTTAGLKGYKITDLSQGYWNFTLYAYKAIKEGETVKGHSDVYSFKGTVTHQKVVKGNLTTVDVTVSPNTDGYGSISFSNKILLDTLDGGHISTLAEQLRMGFGVSAYETPSTPIDSSQWTNLKAGTYIVTVQVYDKDDPGTVYAIESKIVTVYTGLNTEIGGSVGELSAGIQFGDVTAEIIEATSPVIKATTSSEIVLFDSSASTITVTASLPTSTAKEILGTAEAGTTKEMTLTLEVKSNDTTVDPQTKKTSKVYDISLMQTTVTKNNTTGAVSSDVGIIKNLSTAEDKLAKYYLTATLTIDAGLDNVSVTHSTLPMIPFTGNAPDYTQDEQGTVGSEQIWKGFYKYDKSSGVLTIITRSFSPFKVFYTEPTVVTYPVAVYDSSGNLVSGYSTVQAAVDAAAAGQTVKLLADIDLAAQVVVDKELILDLNGKKIYNTKDIWDNADAWSLISVQGKGALTITGKGTLDAKENDCYAIDVRDIRATLVVENGTIVGNIHAIYAYEGFVTVKGGSFSVKQVYSEAKPYEFELNCYDTSYNSGKANFTVTGGTFYKFNPGDNQSEKGGHTDYLADGYMAIKNSDSTYTVVKNDLFPGSGTKANPFRISTAEQFIAIGQLSDLMKSGNEYYFKLTDDIDLRECEFSTKYVVYLLAGYLDGKKDEESSYKIYCPLDEGVESLFYYVNDVEISNIDIILTNHTVTLIDCNPYSGDRFVYDNIDYSAVDDSVYFQLSHNGSLYFSYDYLDKNGWGGQHTIKNCDVKLNLLGGSSNSAVFVGGYIYDYGTEKVVVDNCTYEGTFRGDYVALVLSNGQDYAYTPCPPFRSDFFVVTNLVNKGILIGTRGAYAVGGQNHSGQCYSVGRVDYYDKVQKTTGGQYIILSEEVIEASVDSTTGLVSVTEKEGRKYVVSLYASRDVYNSKNEKWASNYNFSIEFGEFASTKEIFRYDFVDYDTAIADGLIVEGDCDPEKWAPTGGDFSGGGQYQIVSKGNATYYVIRFTESDEQHYRFVIEKQKPTVLIKAYDSENNLVGIKEI